MSSPAESPPAYSPAYSPATVAVSAGRPAAEPDSEVNTPVSFTSTFVASPGAPGPDDRVYARWSNPTWESFEAVLGALEGGRALLFSSGMAAIAATLSLLPDGAVVVAPRTAYTGTLGLLDDLAARGRLTVRRTDLHDLDAVSPLLPGAGLLWVESPSNPLLDVADVPALVAAAHGAGALVAVDNTFATPLVQRPLAHGADVVVHSVTKYLAGHSDVILGATVTRDLTRDLTRDASGGTDLHARLHGHRTLNGAVPGPMEAFLALRGLRTLHLRVERSGANAAELARRLMGHPAVERVRYPGFGSMISIEVSGGVAAAEAVASSSRLWVHATSLGGVESSLERRRRNPGEPAGVPENLLRLSVGIEDVEDLWADLDQALTRR